MATIRACLFYLFGFVVTPVFFVITVLLWPFSPMTRYWVVTNWSRSLMWALRVLCGIDYRVTGIENIPDRPAIVYSKHQSAWETLALQAIFPPQVYIAKKELLWLPLVGWGMFILSQIFVDRGAGAAARDKMVRDARDRMNKGFWIAIFPEGTRTAPGTRRKYKRGGAELAIALDVPLVPVALNSGEFWPRNTWAKRPGTVTVVIGKPIWPEGRDGVALTEAAETWIEAEVERISSPRG